MKFWEYVGIWATNSRSEFRNDLHRDPGISSLLIFAGRKLRPLHSELCIVCRNLLAAQCAEKTVLSMLLAVM